MLGIGGLLLNVTGDSLSQARVGRIDVDSWALTIYRIKTDLVQIVAVIHGARDLTATDNQPWNNL
jgi:plasmid stabilization system protein ParE